VIGPKGRGVVLWCNDLVYTVTTLFFIYKHGALYTKGVTGDSFLIIVELLSPLCQLGSSVVNVEWNLGDNGREQTGSSDHILHHLYGAEPVRMQSGQTSAWPDGMFTCKCLTYCTNNTVESISQNCQSGRPRDQRSGRFMSFAG
jgi:hypothetical protein